MAVYGCSETLVRGPGRCANAVLWKTFRGGGEAGGLTRLSQAPYGHRFRIRFQKIGQISKTFIRMKMNLNFLKPNSKPMPIGGL